MRSGNSINSKAQLRIPFMTFNTLANSSSSPAIRRGGKLASHSNALEIPGATAASFRGPNGRTPASGGNVTWLAWPTVGGKLVGNYSKKL